MTTQLAPLTVQHFTDNNGNLLAGGQLYTYAAGTSTPLATYTDSTGGTANANPVIMNARGEANVWTTGGLSYKFVLKDASGVTIWTVDNIADGSLNSALAAALASTSNLAQGVALVGGAARVVASIAALRTLPKTGSPKIFATGYYVQGDGGGGAYWYDPTDTTTADNGGTVIVASDGGRWKLAYTGMISIKQFGAKGDNVNDDTSAIQATANWISLIGGGTLWVPAGTYKVTSTITLGANVSIQGVGKLVSTFAATSAITGAVFSYLPGSLTTCSIVISDIGITGNATTINALSFSNLTYLTLQRVYFAGFTNAGQCTVLFNDVEDSVVSECMFMNLYGFGLNLTTNSNNCTIRGNAFVAGGGNCIGVKMDSTTQDTVIVGNDFEGASIGTGGQGINCSGSINTLIQGNYFEYWTAACIVANTGSAFNLAIRDNFMIATSSADAYVILNSTGPNDHLTIENNFLDLLGNSGFASIGFFLDNCTNVWARGNKSGGSSTEVIRIGGVAWPSTDYCQINGGLQPNGGLVQTPAGSGTVAVDPALGENLYITLSGNITIANPSPGIIGQVLRFSFVQGGAGGYTVGWGGSYARVVWSNAGNTVNLRASTQFFCIDGTNWVQVGAPQGWA